MGSLKASILPQDWAQNTFRSEIHYYFKLSKEGGCLKGEFLDLVILAQNTVCSKKVSSSCMALHFAKRSLKLEHFSKLLSLSDFNHMMSVRNPDKFVVNGSRTVTSDTPLLKWQKRKKMPKFVNFHMHKFQASRTV